MLIFATTFSRCQQQTDHWNLYLQKIISQGYSFAHKVTVSEPPRVRHTCITMHTLHMLQEAYALCYKYYHV